MSRPGPSDSQIPTASLAAARADLESDDPRRRLVAIGTLSRLVCDGKPSQQAVGAFLRESSASKTCLLATVLADLQASDRTLRCAAARLVCQLAYENLVNQEAIVQLTTAKCDGFSLGWLHVFSVPDIYRTTAAADEPQRGVSYRTAQHVSSQRARSAFLLDRVADNYGDIYTQVSQYYASECQSFLPLCWHFPHRPENSDERDDTDTVPDPADHVLGFYLVPRQTQFLERDDAYHDELLHSLDHHDLQQLQTAKHAFETYTSSTVGAQSVEGFVAYASSLVETEDHPSLRWLLDVPSEAVAALQHYQTDQRTTGSTTLSWSHLFTYACTRLHTDKLVQTFDVSTLQSVATLFHNLAFVSSGSDRITSSTIVWLPVLVAAIQQHSDLPAALKRQIQSLQRSSHIQHHGASPSQSNEPWRVLLHTKLDQVVPVSWAVWLAQWRVALDLDTQLQRQQHAATAAPVRRTSVCSVGDLRRSVVGQLQSQSVRDFGPLQRAALPKAARFASQQDLTGASAFPKRPGEVAATPHVKEDDEWSDDDDEDDDPDSLAHNMALFHRTQRSLAELDALGMEQLAQKQRDKQRVQETVAINKQRAIDDATRRRQLLDEKQRELEATRAELERRKAGASVKVHQLQERKRALAIQRKQQHDAELEQKQLELARSIEERQRRQVETLRRQQQQQTAERPRTHRDEAPGETTAPRPPLSSVSKRPHSARGPRPTATAVAVPLAAAIPSPEVLRQRALLYGHVVSKIYVAEAQQRETTRHLRGGPSADSKPLHQPHQLTRSFSVFTTGSFNVKAPVVKVTPPASRRPRSPRHRRTTRQSHPPERLQDKDDVPENENEADDDDEDDDIVRSSPTRRRQHGTPALNSPSKQASEAATNTKNNACATLVMRNAALAVSERIRIPDVPAPRVEDTPVPPYVVAAQYEALDEQAKRNFRERFNLKSVSHRLSFDVLQQYTKIVRRDMAWRAFHDKCHGSSGHGRGSATTTSSSQARIRYMDFCSVAQALGVSLSEKKLLLVARQLDPRKSGYVEWKAFYTWWTMQYSEYASSGSGRGSGVTGRTATPTRPTTAR